MQLSRQAKAPRRLVLVLFAVVLCGTFVFSDALQRLIAPLGDAAIHAAQPATEQFAKSTAP